MMGLRRNILAGAGGAVVVAMAAWSASAQVTSPYTMPVDTAADSHPAGPNGASQVLAPAHQDQADTADTLPIPPEMPADPGLSQNQTASEKKSWVEMTPEEILGIAPAKKKPAGSNSFDPAKPDSGRSPLEDMLAEQRRAAGGGENSGAASDEANFWSAGAAGLKPRRQGTTHDLSAPGSLLGQLLDSTRSGMSHQNADSEWAGVFQVPQPAPPTPRQLADMEAFREMLNPSLAPEKPKDTSFGDGSLKAPAVDPDVEPASAKYNPNGGTYAPLDAGIGRPKRLDPLPTATGAGGYQAPAAIPSWAPQPPPWKVTTPQLFVEPQRHF